MTSLFTEKINILKEYIDFLDVFFKKFVTILPKRLDNNQHIVNLELNKQPSYRPIYSLDLVELKTLKTYINTHLTNGFI